MEPFPHSYGKLYILLSMDYVSKWVEAITIEKNDVKTMVQFVHINILTWFSAPRCILNDEGSHFYNRVFASLLRKYNVRHAKSLPYHPQSNEQAEISNQEIKVILEKTVSSSRKDWSKKLDDALWAHRTAFKTPIDKSPFRLIFGKPFHLPLELEHRAIWAIRNLNFNLKEASEKILLQLNELKEMCNDSYENAKIYKEKTKRWHDKHLLRKEFKVDDKVLIFNSTIKLFPGKLRSRWSGLVTVTSVTPYGAIGVKTENSQDFKVNGQRLKHYLGEQIAKEIMNYIDV